MNKWKSYTKVHKILTIFGIVLGVVFIVVMVYFIIVANSSSGSYDAVTFEEKYQKAENEINNSINTPEELEGFTKELHKYTDKVKNENELSIDEKDQFLTFSRKVEKKYQDSKIRVIAFYGIIKKQYDEDIKNGYLTGDTKEHVDALFIEYRNCLKEGHYKEAFSKLNSISNNLSVIITEDGARHARTAEEEAKRTAELEAQRKALERLNTTGKAYHTDAHPGDVVVDPNNGNSGVVADNGIEVYKQTNGVTYSYLTKDQFIAMMIEQDPRQGKQMAEMMYAMMANEQGLVPIGVEENGAYM